MSHAAISGRSRADSLPRPIGRALRRLGRRLRAELTVSGLGRTALVTAALAALGMAADFLWVLPQAARWAFWVAWVATSVVAFVATVLRPVVRRSRTFDLAAVAESSHPEIGEPLTSAVRFLAQGSPAHGSPALIAALATQAAEQAGKIVPSRAIPFRQACTRLACGFLAVGLLAAPFTIWPRSYGTLARRFLMPWLDVDRVGLDVLTVKPGDQVLPVGADLPITASLRSRFGINPSSGEAWLEWSYDGEPTSHSLSMPRLASATPGQGLRSPTAVRDFAVTLPKLAGSISYQVKSGGTSSRRYQVTVVEPPSVTATLARVEPPAYTKLPIEIAGDPARIVAFEGSRVTLDLTTSRPVRSMAVNWPTRPGQPAADGRFAARLAGDGLHGSVTLAAEISGPYTVALRDRYGIASRIESPRHVLVTPDAPPEVAVAGNEGQQEASPDDVLSVGVAARDDIAVASVELHYAVERGVGGGRARPGRGGLEGDRLAAGPR